LKGALSFIEKEALSVSVITCSMAFRRDANRCNHKRNVHEIAVEFTSHKGNNESIPKSKKAVISNEGNSEVEEMNATEI